MPVLGQVRATNIAICNESEFWCATHCGEAGIPLASPVGRKTCSFFRCSMDLFFRCSMVRGPRPSAVLCCAPSTTCWNMAASVQLWRTWSRSSRSCYLIRRRLQASCPILPYLELTASLAQLPRLRAGMGMAASPQQHRFTKRLLPWAGKLREAAAYGLGVCAKHGGAQFGVYAPQVVQALSEMLSAEPKVRRPLVSIQNLTCRHTNSKADCDAPAHYCHMPHMIWLVLPAYSLCLTAPWPPVPFGLWPVHYIMPLQLTARGAWFSALGYIVCLYRLLAAHGSRRWRRSARCVCTKAR